MGTSVVKWVADDGTAFDTEEEMLVHELALVDSKEIDIFLSMQDVTPRRIAEYKKLLTSWQSHMREQSLKYKQLELPLNPPEQVWGPERVNEEIDRMLSIADGNDDYWPDALEAMDLKPVAR